MSENFDCYVCGHAPTAVFEVHPDPEEPCPRCRAWAQGVHDYGALEFLHRWPPLHGREQYSDSAIALAEALRAVEMKFVVTQKGIWRSLGPRAYKAARSATRRLIKQDPYMLCEYWVTSEIEGKSLLWEALRCDKLAWLAALLNPERVYSPTEFDAIRKGHRFTRKDAVSLIASSDPDVRTIGFEIMKELGEKKL